MAGSNAWYFVLYLHTREKCRQLKVGCGIEVGQRQERTPTNDRTRPAQAAQYLLLFVILPCPRVLLLFVHSVWSTDHSAVALIAVFVCTRYEY